MGLKHLKRCFFISGTQGGFFGGFYWRFFRWVHPKKPTGFFGYVPGCLKPEEPADQKKLL